MEFEDDVFVLGDEERDAVPPALAAPPLPKTQAAAEVRASFVSRVAAFVIDVLVLIAADITIAMIAATGITLARLHSGELTGPSDTVLEPTALAGSLLFALSYFTVLQTGSGQTLGKALFGIEVRQVNGAPLTWPRSLLRCLGLIVSALTLGIGFLVAARPSGRALHDLIAETVVVRTKEVSL